MKVTENPIEYDVVELDHEATRYYPDGTVESGHVGDYLIIAPDGSSTFCPKADFSKRYTEVGTTTPSSGVPPSLPPALTAPVATEPIASNPSAPSGVAGFTGGVSSGSATHPA